MGRIFRIITCLLGFLTGVALYPFFKVTAWISFIYLLVFFCANFLKFIRPYREVAWIALAIAFGLLRAGISEHIPTPGDIDFYVGKSVTIEGVVTEADIRSDAAKYTVTVEGWVPSVTLKADNRLSAFADNSGDQASQIIRGDILITLQKYPQYHYGDRLRISGKLESPGEFEGFSYDHYLSRFGIYAVMYRPNVIKIGEERKWSLWRALEWSQSKFMESINRIFPEPHASFEAGLLIGARKGIPDELMQKFNTTGLTHIIAVSGFNITIVIAFVMGILKFLPRKKAFLCAVIGVVLFVLFVGASPSVVRAGIMGILSLIALNTGRQNNIHITLLLAAAFMILWNPKILWWDVGFQLSFAAVMGLLYVSPWFEKFTQKIPNTLGIREGIMMTLSAQVIAFPLIAFHFGRFSLIAPLANILVAFAIPLAMLFGFIAVLISWILFPAGLLFGYITWGILSYILWIVQIMAKVPYAGIEIPHFGFALAGVYYLALVFWLARRKSIRKPPMTEELALAD